MKAAPVHFLNLLSMIYVSALASFTPVAAQIAQPGDISESMTVGKKPPPGMMYAPGHAAPVRKPAHIPPKHRIGELVLPVPDNSLWFRYYKAGESASFSGNKALAHKYWLASLNELEKVKPNPDDDLMSVKLSALEQALTYSYPADWSKATEPAADVAKQREEQVSVLEKMATINRRLVPKDTLLCQKSYERFDIAKKSFEKAVADAKTAPNSSSQ